jgi:hypothetical protein
VLGEIRLCSARRFFARQDQVLVVLVEVIPKAPALYKYEKNQIELGSDVEFVTYHGFDFSI